MDMGRENTEKCIAILSMQRIVNFGSVLQAYSLRNIIWELTGQKASFLDIDLSDCCPSIKSIPESVDYETPVAYPPGNMQKAKRRVISKLSAYNKHLIHTFMHKELELDTDLSEKYSHVVIGSDEVLNHRNETVCLQLHGKVENADHVFTYAASCGNARAEDILDQDRIRVKDALDHLSEISVRDDATATYVQGLCGRDTLHHLDPVLVGDLYDRKHKPVWLKNYLIVYAYGHRIRTADEISAIQRFAREHSLKTVAIGGSQFWCDLYLPLSPFRVLDYFYYADYVVTDTFHGAIFSIINQRKFAVIPRKTNQAKVLGLLSDLGLSNRVLQGIDQLEAVLTEDIPYDAVDEILARERIRTREYLQKQLGV